MKDFILKFILILRKGLYFFYSNNTPFSGSYICHQPVVLRGEGDLIFGSKVTFGVLNSPHLHASYAYIEARSKESKISFGNNVNINNAFSVVAETKITINDDVLIGYNCNISDSNFHDLAFDKRGKTDPDPQEVTIEKNVFIGNNVTILKGVIIGENSVVATGSIVTKSCPKNVVIAGCPAKIIRHLI